MFVRVNLRDWWSLRTHVSLFTFKCEGESSHEKDGFFMKGSKQKQTFSSFY